MYILGISCHYHEASAALIKDGRIIAASAEERFSRKKHDASFPRLAIDFCLKEAGITSEKLDYVVFYEKPLVKFERTVTVASREYPHALSFFARGMHSEFSEKIWIASTISAHFSVPREKILFVPQHLAHAAASFYPSPFKHAAFLTLDAVGEWTTGSWGKAGGNTLYPVAQMHFPDSVGLLYSACTAYLGFEVNDGEFKVMGMAAYGKPVYTDRIKKLYRQHTDGSITLSMKYFDYHRSSSRMYTKKFEQLFKGCGRFDIGASIQKCTEEIIFTMMQRIYEKTKETNLVFGGGVALNSVVNGMVTRKTPFRRLFIFPAAGDDGAAAGAALYAYHHALGNIKRYPLEHVFFGEHFSNRTIEQFLTETHIVFKKMDSPRLVPYVAKQLSQGKVIGWFEGRAEFGPRALGHRSIIADPRKKEMKDIVNARIKFREEFRPFAPFVLKRFVHKYFVVTEQNLTPYMLGTFRTTSLARRNCPAVVHDDGTSRIQIVDTSSYPGLYARVLEEFYRETGVPVLLNTSFNLKGEPIVNSPADAYSTFSRSGLDILVLGNYVIMK